MKHRLVKKLTSFITAAAITASIAVMPVSVMAFNAPEADTGAAGEISNGGEWTIYASKAGQIKSNSGAIADVTQSAGVVEVTKDLRSAALQFDLSSKDKADKVIKSAKLRLTPMVSKTNLQQTVSVISNEFKDTTGEYPVAQFSVPRVGTDDFNTSADLKAITDVAEYPAALKSWQTDIDVTGEVVGADDTLSLHVVYATGNTNKTEYATCNAAANARLKEYKGTSNPVPFLYNDGATAYSKWVYPQIVLTYTDAADYTAAYHDFVTASTALSEAVVTAENVVSAPTASGGSTVTLESADETGLVIVENNKISYNPNYAGGATKANVRLTVTKGAASYSKIVQISVDAVVSYEINFDTTKNPLGEISVSVGNTTYTDGTAYAQAGNTVTVDGGANTGYTADVSVKKAADNSEVTVTDGSFIMPEEAVNVSVAYAKQSQYGTTRVAATNSISIQGGGNLQSPNLVIGADRITFVKFDLSGYNADIISEADINFTLTKNATLNTKAVFYVPNNDWSESRINKNFKLDGTNDTDISQFKYTSTAPTQAAVYEEDGIIIIATYHPDQSLSKVQISGSVKANDEVQEIKVESNQKAFVWTSLESMKPVSTKQITVPESAESTVSLLNGENHKALIVPNTDDASTAAEGILKDYYAASTGTQKTCTISVTDAVKTALKTNTDGIVTFMVYSAGGGNDVYSVNGAGSLAARPSITITESAEFLSDDDLITEIKTVNDLESFAAIVNGGNSYSGKTVTLANDLDLSEIYSSTSGKSWTPIGVEATGGLKSFAGTFDGQNHTVSGLYINDNDGVTLGLFGDVSGEVKNLTVTGTINGSSVIGGIAASCNGTITNCHSNVVITAQREAGGIVGTLANGGVVSDSDNKGNVTISNKETYAGGIAGHNIDGIVRSCNNSGKIENSLDGFRNKLGGIVGFLDNGVIEGSTNTGEIVSNATVASYTGDRSHNYVGGIVGYSSYGTITNSGNSGSVHNAVDYAGGIVGYLQSGDTVSGCTNNGNVSAETYAGGIVGFNRNSIVESCTDNSKG